MSIIADAPKEKATLDLVIELTQKHSSHQVPALVDHRS